MIHKRNTSTTTTDTTPTPTRNTNSTKDVNTKTTTSPTTGTRSSHNSSKRKGKRKLIRNLILIVVIVAVLFWSFALFTFTSMHTRNNNQSNNNNNNNNSNNKKFIQQSSPDEGSSNKYQTSHAHKEHRNENDNQKDDAAAYLTMYGRHRFESSFDALPKWLQDYFTWHRAQTQSINVTSKTNNNISNNINNNSSDDKRYVVLLCLPKDTLCGGLSDRLRPLAFYLLIAKYTNRVLCIHWEKPFALEEFLQPIPDPDVTIDWRCPSEVNDLYDSNRIFSDQPNVKTHVFGGAKCQKKNTSFASCVERDVDILKANQDKFVTIDLATHSNDCINDANLLVQRHSYGKDDVFVMPDIAYWQYPEIIGDIFRIMFEPIPLLAKRINATMTSLDLVENEFVSTHVRARYPAGYIMKFLGGGRNQTFDKDGGLIFEGKLKNWINSIVKNAVTCGHLLAPDLKVFFISDHNDATNYALSTEISLKGGDKIKAIGLNRKEEPLHMDGNNHQMVNAANFYSVFEDLLIMGGSRCVSHGIGSFGSFGAGLTGNRCRAIHRKYNAQPVTCPNDRGGRKSITFDASEMMFGEKPGGHGKIKY